MIRRTKYKGRIGALLLTFCLLAGGCQAGQGDGTESAGLAEQETAKSTAAEGGAEASPSEIVQFSDLFDDEDFEIGFDENESAQIVCGEDAVQCGSAVGCGGGGAGLLYRGQGL